MLSVRAKNHKKKKHKKQGTKTEISNANQKGTGWETEFGQRQGSRMGLGLALGLAKCGTFVDATVLGLISGFHAIAKKKQGREKP